MYNLTINIQAYRGGT